FHLQGYHSLQSYRVAHVLWNTGHKVLALALQSRISEVFGVDIHPAAKIGEGILLDHGTGVVIGETAVVGNRVSLMHVSFPSCWSVWFWAFEQRYLSVKGCGRHNHYLNKINFFFRARSYL
ncbi:Serine acetyltransferase 2, partial [Linum perenne]